MILSWNHTVFENPMHVSVAKTTADMLLFARAVERFDAWHPNRPHYCPIEHVTGAAGPRYIFVRCRWSENTGNRQQMAQAVPFECIGRSTAVGHSTQAEDAPCNPTAQGSSPNVQPSQSTN